MFLYLLSALLTRFLTYLVLYWPGWSSFSEVAAYWGGEGGRPVPILVAGRDFGLVVEAPPVLAAAPKRPRRDVAHKSA